MKLSTLKLTVNEKAYSQIKKSFFISGLIGVLEGLSILCLLPISTIIINGKTKWGLNTFNWLFIISILALLCAVLEYFKITTSYFGALDLLRNLHTRIGNKLATLPLGWFNAERAGELSQLAAKGILNVGEYYTHIATVFITNGSASIIIILGAFIWNWRMGSVLIFAIPLTGFIIWLATKLASISEKSIYMSQIETNKRLLEFGGSQITLRACGKSDSYSPLEIALNNEHSAAKKQYWITLISATLNGIIIPFITAMIIILAAKLALIKVFGVLETIAFIGIALRASQYFNNVVSLVSALKTLTFNLEKIKTILTAPTLPEPKKSIVKNSNNIPSVIDFKNVYFSYSTNKPVLNGISFTAPAGSMTAIVGPSGCGKTTLAKLICRFYDVEKGKIQIDKKDIREHTNEELMSKISMVFQDVYLFDDTLAANLKVGKSDANHVDLQYAANLAGVTEIVNRLPAGWETQVGEGGTALSGGERQRVAIARAILKKSPIVILDEATSALDVENENRINASINELKKHATIIIIAHKLSTILAADNIVVLDKKGTVIQQGNHETLIKTPGQYQLFFQSRNQAQDWKLIR